MCPVQLQRGLVTPVPPPIPSRVPQRTHNLQNDPIIIKQQWYTVTRIYLTESRQKGHVATVHRHSWKKRSMKSAEYSLSSPLARKKGASVPSRDPALYVHRYRRARINRPFWAHFCFNTPKWSTNLQKRKRPNQQVRRASNSAASKQQTRENLTTPIIPINRRMHLAWGCPDLGTGAHKVPRKERRVIVATISMMLLSRKLKTKMNGQSRSGATRSGMMWRSAKCLHAALQIWVARQTAMQMNEGWRGRKIAIPFSCLLLKSVLYLMLLSSFINLSTHALPWNSWEAYTLSWWRSLSCKNSSVFYSLLASLTLMEATIQIYILLFSSAHSSMLNFISPTPHFKRSPFTKTYISKRNDQKKQKGL